MCAVERASLAQRLNTLSGMWEKRVLVRNAFLVKIKDTPIENQASGWHSFEEKTSHLTPSAKTSTNWKLRCNKILLASHSLTPLIGPLDSPFYFFHCDHHNDAMATLKPPTDKALRRWVSTDSLHSSRYAWPFLAKPKSSSNLHAIQTLKLGIGEPVPPPEPKNEAKLEPTIRRIPHKKFIRPGQPLYKPVSEYVQRFKGLVKLEQQASEQRFNTRMMEWPLDKLKQEGYVITDLGGYHARKRWGKPSAIFQLQPGQHLPSHRFRKGETIKLSSMDNETRKWSGTVDSVTPTQIQLLFDRRVPIRTDERYRIDIALADISYKRSLEALESLCLDPVEQAETPGNALKGTHLRDILIDGSTNYDGIFANDCWIRSWASRYSKPDPITVEGDPDLKLNPRQLQAVALMIGNRASLIQGPPGTGKTATISNSIKLMKVRRHPAKSLELSITNTPQKYFKIPHPILIAAYTNVATDNIASILSKADLKITRLGHISRVAPELHNETLVAQVEAHPRYTEVMHARIKSEGLFRRATEMDGLLKGGCRVLGYVHPINNT